MAEHLGLSPAAVSTVLNRRPAADAIPESTKQRIFAAARELGYRPNYLARSLRSQRSFSVGVLVPEISEGYAANVLGGIETGLLAEGYFYLVTSHRSSELPVERYLELLADRAVEGYILVNTPLEGPPPLPAVAISGHAELDRVTNVVVDHERASILALSHLAELGHRRLAVFRGHPDTADAEERWQMTRDTAATLGLEIPDEAVVQLGTELEGRLYTPEEAFQEGYAFAQELLRRRQRFTALVAFNDVSAIGAMRALRDVGLDVPGDLSVIGFDDIPEAAFQIPRLTTVRQPLRQMGRTACELLLRLLHGGDAPPQVVRVEPELVVRESTAAPAAGGR
ncbi:MAG TPA: LacI family DNA-binding transcriptional regulator [Thermoanaerobaculia bacterium]|nr:LacI family DNA-binding transcriptional regulator [Thermoanaerobaculia bacterium]